MGGGWAHIAMSIPLEVGGAQLGGWTWLYVRRGIAMGMDMAICTTGHSYGDGHCICLYVCMYICMYGMQLTPRDQQIFFVKIEVVFFVGV